MGKFYYPLQSLYKDPPAGKNTYPGHGKGKLDFPAPEGTKIYAMTSGTVTRCGTYSDGATTCCEVTVSGYGSMNSFIIRYLHGVFNVGTGDVISQGQVIGTVSDKGSPGSFHLHVDFQPIGYSNAPGIDVRTYNSGVSAVEQQFINNNIDHWAAQSSSNYKGYCWQVFGRKASAQSAYSGGSDYNAKLDVSKIRTLSEEDWLAIYGMLIYEEGGIFEGKDDKLTATAICEWVMRVFRNRLLSGTSVDSICQWDSGNPGRRTAISKGRTAGEAYKTIARNIITGNNYWAVEQKAKSLGGANFSSKKCSYGTTEYLIRLQSADTFSGGRNQRWGTLVDIPFSHGGRFFCEDEMSSMVAKKYSTGFFNGTQCPKWNSL